MPLSESRIAQFDAESPEKTWNRKTSFKKTTQTKQNYIFTKPKQSISRFISLAEQFRDPPMTPRSHLPIKRKQTSPMSDPRFLGVLFRLTWKTKSGEIVHVTRMKPTTVWRKTWKNKKKSAKKYRGKSTKPRLILQNVFLTGITRCQFP